ncbi:hypothetical protein [Sphingobacterium faecium]|uniref:hypothetical protein n=1 Tax=Sphingobacterium faecium TaxID=34087 RepID=UPI00247974E2|nr:hypothetical protein [Sphingobacterium faecium]WGQ15590.1 hypothetical protein QG727_04090 [Sphingobacterium faecium]
MNAIEWEKDAEKRFSADSLQRMTDNAKNMFAFVIGQKVNWITGRYDYYFVQSGYKENGIKFYDIINPLGATSPRVREEELLSV